MPVAPPRRSNRLAERPQPVEVQPPPIAVRTRARAAAETSAKYTDLQQIQAQSAASSTAKRTRSAKTQADSGPQAVLKLIAEAAGDKKVSQNKKKKASKKKAKNNDSARAPEENNPVDIDPAPALAQIAQSAEIHAAPVTAPVALTRLELLTAGDELTDEEIAALFARTEVHRRKREAIIALGINVIDVVQVTPALSQEEINYVKARIEDQAPQQQIPGVQTPQSPRSPSTPRISQSPHARHTPKEPIGTAASSKEIQTFESDIASPSKKRRRGDLGATHSSVEIDMHHVSFAEPVVRPLAPSPPVSPFPSPSPRPRQSRHQMLTEIGHAVRGQAFEARSGLSNARQINNSGAISVNDENSVSELNAPASRSASPEKVKNKPARWTFASGTRERVLPAVPQDNREGLPPSIRDEAARYNMGLFGGYRDRCQHDDDD
jgi:hypothetical protein